jgi:RNA polymerase sigma-70 factor (ECF subfamily)
MRIRARDLRKTMTAHSAKSGAADVDEDDLSLVHASKQGNLTAFEQLVERYDGKLLRIAQHITHNWEDSEDVVQEAFLKAFQHLREFRGDSKFSTWLIRITVNESLMRLRKQRTTREVSMDVKFDQDGNVVPLAVADGTPNPEDLCKTCELRDILARTVTELQPILRAVFVLRDIEGLSILETAEVLDLTQAAVKARLWRARLQLRKRLAKYFRVEPEPSRTQFPHRALGDPTCSAPSL